MVKNYCNCGYEEDKKCYSIESDSEEIKVKEKDMAHEEFLKIKENTPTIETERLILRRFTKDDVEAIERIFGNEKVNTFLPMFRLKNLEEAEKYLEERYLSFYETEEWGYHYAICLKEDNIPFGYVDIGKSDSHDTGWGMLPEYWGHGYVSEAAKAVVEKAQAAGLPFITATHDRLNPKSGKVMQRLGMSYHYSYLEQWLPKDYPVIFRMYQLNLNGDYPIYDDYQKKYPNNFVEVIED